MQFGEDLWATPWESLSRRRDAFQRLAFRAFAGGLSIDEEHRARDAGHLDAERAHVALGREKLDGGRAQRVDEHVLRARDGMAGTAQLLPRTRIEQFEIDDERVAQLAADQGRVEVLEARDEHEGLHALRAKYRAYAEEPPSGPLLELVPESALCWSAQDR